MKNIIRSIREVLKQSASEIKANWKFSQRVPDKRNKISMYALVYMITGYFLIYVSLCFISILYILFGIIGGAILGLKESPYWFLLFLLPITALPFLYFVHNMWTSHYTSFKNDYFIKHSIQVRQEE